MAWPFKKQAKKRPKPPSTPGAAAKKKLPARHKVAVQKPVNFSGVNAKIARLEGHLAALNKKFDTFKKTADSTTNNINIGISEAIHNDSAIVKKIRADERTESANHSENKNKIKNLDATNRNIYSKINAIKGDIAKISARQDAMEKSWNPSVLKRISETISSVNDMLIATEKRNSKNVRILERIHAGISAISQHASHIEAEHTDAKFAAKELADKAKNLKETVDYFFKNTESLNNRINANTAGLTDLTNTLDMIKDKLLAVENQSAQLAKFSGMLEQNSRNIDQLIQKVAYLEKATIKTIVLE